jgi:hypothetical protein
MDVLLKIRWRGWRSRRDNRPVGSVMLLEVVDFALVPPRGLKRIERAEIASAPGPLILLEREKAILA